MIWHLVRLKQGAQMGFTPCFFAIIQVIPENKAKAIEAESRPWNKQTDPLDLLIWGLPKTDTHTVASVDCQSSLHKNPWAKFDIINLK